MRKDISFSRLCLGIGCLIVGFGYIGNLFHIWHFTIFFPGWWTLFIILPALANVYENGFGVWNVTWLVFGFSLLLGEYHLIAFQDVLRFGLPVFCIIIGICILMKRDE